MSNEADTESLPPPINVRIVDATASRDATLATKGTAYQPDSRVRERRIPLSARSRGCKVGCSKAVGRGRPSPAAVRLAGGHLAPVRPRAPQGILSVAYVTSHA